MMKIESANGPDADESFLQEKHNQQGRRRCDAEDEAK